MPTKYIDEFKAGDVITAYGSKFKITADAYSAEHHISDVYRADAEVIDSEELLPGEKFTFQGNRYRGKFYVQAE